VSEPEDHIAGIHQLAQRYPYMDVSRVGIYGSTGGGNQAARSLLKYPDFYNVGVANAGSHDYRAQMHCWAEAYIGPLETGDYAAASSLPLAGNLRGKLLLSHAGLDENVSSTQTMKLVDALIKANRDFDLLLLPNDTLASGWISPYFLRRMWDFFVRHLLGTEPPAGYAITRPTAGT
jgi:dipeptidyl aminopeptidase/acylaminoacyl peptidase